MLTLPKLPTIAARLVWAREQRGLTQEELADKASVSRDIIAKAETAKIKRPRKMKEIADALDVPPAWLAFGDERIDTWDADTIEMATAYNALPPALRQAVKNLMEQAAGHTQPSS